MVDQIIGIILGGIIGFGSSIGTTFLQRWIARPRISISEQTTEVRMNYRELDSDQVTEIAEEAHAIELTEFMATRIKVENNGMTAAENCKASLIVGTNENRVAWMLPKDDFTVIINAHDSEYIDLCVISERVNNEGHRTRFVTTERGYGESQQHGTVLHPGTVEGVIKVSAKNARGCLKQLWISDIPDEQSKIIHF